ncbi:hypothetical protein [Pigmentiphaga litoralis]|uniref:hypothetical protein n=1 Tax=Pigmentiphaga litoralis TaxID=516702 RepID=UPI001674D8C1|nr:hypothetical protein [Pigmentiphaga litoralis]
MQAGRGVGGGVGGITLLPHRLARVFVPTWGDAEFAKIDRQLAEAVRLGLLAKKPDRPVYTRV